MDTMDLEDNREKSEAVAVHQEVNREGETVEAIGALEVRSGDKRLAVGCWKPLKSGPRAMM
jgi:hypothetical protein